MAGDPIAEYEAMWRSLKWWQRLGHRIWWKAATVWAGLVGGITPGERLVLRAWSAQAWCPECGAVDRHDEDGCCLMCGATIISAAVVDSITAPHRARAERLQVEADRLTRERDEAREAAGVAQAEYERMRNERDRAQAAGLSFMSECDTLRALLERCEPVIVAYMLSIEAYSRSSYERANALLTEITAALHQPKDKR